LINNACKFTPHGGQVASLAHCLARVKARIIEQPFLPDDELFQMVEKARDLTFKFHELAGDGLPSSEG